MFINLIQFLIQPLSHPLSYSLSSLNSLSQILPIFSAIFIISSILALISKKVGYTISAIASLTLIAISVKSLISSNFMHSYSITAYFTLISSIVWFCASLYSIGYDKYGKRVCSTFSLSIASMLIILWAKDALSFLVGWEVMTIASYLALSARDDGKAAYKFLAFGELSTLFLALGFSVGIAANGSIYFSQWMNYYWLVFLLCLFGFSIKMAIFPFYTWLPPAHGNAPSNFSALLSAVLTLMGVYGIVRLLAVGVNLKIQISPQIALLMLALGSVTAIYGALHAAVSEVVKELPAYSTVENDGIILVLLGAYIIALHYSKVLAAYAMFAALFYIFAHSTSKALLFLTSGIIEKSGRTFDEFISSKKRLSNKIAFSGFVAAFSLAAIPPLPGFLAEWMTLETLFQSFDLHTPLRLAVVLAGALVALAAGISTISMSKIIVYGFSKSGKGKSDKDKSNERNMPSKLLGDEKSVTFGVLTLSAIVILIGVYPQFVFTLFSPALEELTAFNSSKFIGGLLSIPKGFLVISGNGFGCTSPTILAVFIVLISTITAFILRIAVKVKTARYDKPWVGGELSENYKPLAYSTLLRLTLKSFYRTKESESGISWCDFFDKVYTEMSKKFSELCDDFRVLLMNGSTGNYVLYILVAMILVLIYSLV